MRRPFCFFLIVLLAPILFEIPGASQAVGKAACFKTYIITPGNIKIAARIFKLDHTPGQIASIQAGETERYRGFDYRRTGEPATKKENCAGYVMRYVFPQFKQGVIDADELYTKIVKPFGSKRFNALTAAAQDVVVYTNDSGGPAHYALVVSADRTGIVIRSKDNKESPFIGTFPRSPNFLTDDPLIRSYRGTVEFWQIDKSRFSIEEAAPGDCDDGYAVFLLTNCSGGSIWVGMESRLKTMHTCDFRGGGLCASRGGQDVPIQYVKKSADFESCDEAYKTYEANLKSRPRDIPLTRGKKAALYGAEYWVDTVEPCR